MASIEQDKLSTYTALQAQLAALQAQLASLKSDPEVVKRQGELDKLNELAKSSGYDTLDIFLSTHGFSRETKKAKRTRLTDEQKSSIRSRVKNGESMASIARELGCSNITIAKAVKERTTRR